VKAKSEYGTPSEGIPANLLKKNVKTIIIVSGWITAHKTPSAVCLYLTFMSRKVKT
jgi:hypothetical protein